MKPHFFFHYLVVLFLGLTLANGVEAAGPQPLVGDLNGNKVLDAMDLDLLRNLTSADLNLDGVVDFQDRRFWLHTLKNTWFGDSDLDQRFNSHDLTVVFDAGKYELDLSANWNDGDWNGDYRFDTLDLVAAFEDGGYEVEQWLRGDYNGNRKLDPGDLDLQAVEMTHNRYTPSFDEDGDQSVDFEDRVRWLNDLKHTWIGDANFDDHFNVYDLVQIFTAGKYETGLIATWEEGDFTGDMLFNTADFVVIGSHGTCYEESGDCGPYPGEYAKQVPEPQSPTILIWGFIIVLLVTHHHTLNAPANAAQKMRRSRAMILALLLFSAAVFIPGRIAFGKPRSIVGDFTLDGQISDADVDLHMRVVLYQDYWFDLNGDEQIDHEDRLIWISDLVRTFRGDANLDGSFDTADMVQIFQFGEYEDGIPQNSGWTEGDFNGDGEFNSADFVFIFDAGCYEQGPRPDDGTPGSWSWEQYSWGERPAPTPGTGRWLADLDLDQQITAADIDLLSAAVREGNDEGARTLFQERGFDLNQDGQINGQDRTVWVKEIAQTYFGDANLDHELDTSDFVQIFQAGKYEKDANALWAEGDANGDYRFGASDLVLIATELPDSGPPPQPVVPEPSATSLLLFALVGLITASRLG